jgi:hypothetical protein
MGELLLQILNPPPYMKSPGFKMRLDRHLVLASVSREEVSNYLRQNRHGHRLLSPAEVLGPIIAMRDGDGENPPAA